MSQQPVIHRRRSMSAAQCEATLPCEMTASDRLTTCPVCLIILVKIREAELGLLRSRASYARGQLSVVREEDQLAL